MYRSRKLIRPTGLTGPLATQIDQHCLVESFSTGTGGTFTRRMDYVTVRNESLHGPGTVWVDYEIPGIMPRQVGPRGQFDTAHHAAAFTFPIAQPPPGSSLVVTTGAVWSDGSTHENDLTLAPPTVCGQTAGNGADNDQWGIGRAAIRFTQQCVLAADGPHIRWVSRVTAELAAGDPSGDAWVDYWVSNGGRADYQRATQGHFDPGSHTLTLTFDVPATRRGGIELGVIGSYDQEGRSFSAHAWAPLKYCFTRFPD